MPEVINQDGEELTWTAKYWRYHSPYEERCDSLEQAIRFLHWGEEAGTLSSESIVGPDGRVVYDSGTGDSIWDLGDRLESGEPASP